MNEIGFWKTDDALLPCFEYTGKLPYKAKLKNGNDVKLPSAPWFLLGNYRLTMFTHVSGEYELISGQRSWARINHGEGGSSSDIKINGENFPLTGIDSLAANPDVCKRTFGIGFAEFDYAIGDVSLVKNFSVKPSTLKLQPQNVSTFEDCNSVRTSGQSNKSVSQETEVKISGDISDADFKPSPYNGSSAFVLNIIIKNNGNKNAKIEYSEKVKSHFKMIQYQQTPDEDFTVKYKSALKPSSDDKNLMIIETKAECDDPLLLGSRDDMSKFDGFPPSLFMKSISDDVELSGNDNELCANIATSLNAGEEKSFSIIIGFAFEDKTSTAQGNSEISIDTQNLISSIEKICEDLESPIKNSPSKTKQLQQSAFADDWKKIIPDFASEKDADLRRELQWHVYNLEAMATYSEYYGETKIPQGTIYDYAWGCHASARDNFQHALPLCYYNPALAKSTLRYMLERTTPFGEIRLIECGNGYADNERYFTSDQQLYYFLLLSEYLRVTGDYDFLSAKITPYPAKNQTPMTVLAMTEKCFIFLRDTIGIGNHGLVRLLNSDWNDAVYYIEKVPYNNIFFTGESHMNSAMAISILQNLIPQLRKAGEKISDGMNEKIANGENKNFDRLENLCASMELYRKNILDAFVKDLNDRKFPRRMYFNNRAYGDDNMFLEPMGFTLQIKEFSESFKRNLFKEMETRLYSNEKLGAREQENPEFDDDGFDKGSRENGGFWWSLNGPVIVGVKDFDKSLSEKLLKKMTLKNLAESFPEYWSSYWSAADNQESSLIPEEGLPDQSLTYWEIPVYCAHPHAWILYCWYELHEDD